MALIRYRRGDSDNWLLLLIIIALLVLVIRLWRELKKARKVLEKFELK